MLCWPGPCASAIRRVNSGHGDPVTLEGQMEGRSVKLVATKARLTPSLDDSDGEVAQAGRRRERSEPGLVQRQAQAFRVLGGKGHLVRHKPRPASDRRTGEDRTV